MSTTKNVNTDQRCMLRIILNITGLLFIFLALFIFSAPQVVEDFFGMTPDISRILAICLIFAGFCDFLLARFMFRERTK